MIYLGLPLGTVHGWGVCGRMIARELARLTQVELYTDPLHPVFVSDAFEDRHIRSLLSPGADPLNPPPGQPVNGPVLQGVAGIHALFRPSLRGTFNVGYTFFEDRLPAISQTVFPQLDYIVAGSTWCAEKLREAGATNVSVILQGIEPRNFNPLHNEKLYFQDRFVIFSGGKIEYRKGQDLVIAAYRVLQQRHKDVMLVNLWSNPWPQSAQTIGLSKHIEIPALNGDHVEVVNQLLAANGIDVSRVISLPPQPNALMAGIYKNTDIGLFPNRCEGGTNLVMMEYMACGKPVIASDHTGHRDIVTDANALPLRQSKPEEILNERGEVHAVWHEANLEEIIAKLEFAYQNRDALKPLAHRAGEDLAKMTWTATAQQFYELISPHERCN